ncbi:hypothetical protein AAHA92_20113 [Salvia divinorum]|uniref:F-box domain-containing protein n=1 Tax=Salvia divinorum TaxID=28513 RepID=A0ABD1GIT4_SALDI
MDDRLSELPESLILVILSFLPMTYLVTTTLLSKRWKHLWTTVPSLHLRHPIDADFDKFQAFVSRALTHWRVPKLLKFTIDISFYLHMSGCIDSCLLFAIDHQVEELHLEATPSFYSIFESRMYYVPHPRLYSCSSITKLTLASVELSIGESVRWNRLNSLTIEDAVSLSEDTMNKIFSGAPVLEALNLHVRESGEDLNIRSASLKMLKIVMSGLGSESKAALRVLALNLETLEISGISYTRCLLEVPS